MIKEIKDIKDYSFNPILESKEKLYNTPITLFGKTWRIMDDYWMRHIHIKVTDGCDCHCPFCIEKDSHVREDFATLFYNLSRLMQEMNAQGYLATVSITGGEPSLYDHIGDIIDYVKLYNVFLNINTNFHRIIPSKYDPDWLNISRHVIGEDSFTGIHKLNVQRVKNYRNLHPSTKIRLQCVLHPNGLHSIEDIMSYIENYIGVADDLSFRRLISTTDESSSNDLYQQLKHFLYNNSDFVEQVLKDYYVYETWNYKGLNITLSHSNMKLLYDLERTEDDSILREIVVHPDGLISGSWYRDRKIIADTGNISDK